MSNKPARLEAWFCWHPCQLGETKWNFPWLPHSVVFFLPNWDPMSQMQMAGSGHVVQPELVERVQGGREATALQLQELWSYL